jgi:methyl-accepting chemotaxis protein
MIHNTMYKIKSSLALTLTFSMLTLLLASALIIGALGLFFYDRSVVAANANLAQKIALSTAAGIDGDKYEKLAQSSIEDEYYDELKALFDEIKTQTDSRYLYGLNNGVDGKIKYVAEGQTPTEDIKDIGKFGEVEPAGTYSEKAFVTLETGEPSISEIYQSGEYGKMVSGFAPVTNSKGQVVGVVGVDISLSTVMKAVLLFGLKLLGAALITSLLSGFVIVRYINRKIGRPIDELAVASNQIAVGDMDINVKSTSLDEIGQLIQAFNKMAESTRHQVEVLTRIADCDYTVDIAPRSPKDELNRAIKLILDNNISLISGIQNSSQQVACGASQVASTAQSLATGASEQATTLEQFSSSISDVHHQAKENTEATAKALEQVAKASELIEQSVEQINQLSEAMTSIERDSREISNIIKVIDDIAFRTNILALNAAVEAARAGQQGKGFAVVADEVRNLAQKSAEAARETVHMIENSERSVKLGSQTMRKAEEKLREMSLISAENARSIQLVNEASQLQRNSIDEINMRVDQIASVIQSNSALAEESAASAEEMSAQATVLEEMVQKFNLP